MYLTRVSFYKVTTIIDSIFFDTIYYASKKAIVHQRDLGCPWTRFVVLEGADLELDTLGLRLPLAQLYRGITLVPLIDDAG